MSFFKLITANDYPKLSDEFSFIDPDEASKPFEPHYKTHILPHVKIFELRRIEALESLRKRTLITIPIHIIAVLFIVIYFSYVSFLIGFSIMGVIGFWAERPISKYKTSVKTEIFPEIFKFFGEDFQYSEDSQLKMELLDVSRIIPSYDNSYLEDYVKGSYKDVTMELTEANLTKVEGYGKHRRTVTVFNGIFILLEMNKNFSGSTIVKKDEEKIWNLFTKSKDLENVKLEDPVFEKKFEVYSTDQVEARYLLTPSFMERLLELSDIFSEYGRGVIQCSFYMNKLLLMIPSSKNRFEVGSIYQPATFVDDINDILKEMAVIFQIIDILKLERKTGL